MWSRTATSVISCTKPDAPGSDVPAETMASAAPTPEKVMNKMWIPILFALGTAFFFGCYGPTIGMAQAPKGLKPPEGWTPFKPYLFIGIAYLLIAILGGSLMMRFKGDSFVFTGDHFRPAQWGFFAGCFGAFGALCLTTAMMTSRGNALLVMPIVFGGAVTVTAIISIVSLHEQLREISPLLWLGIALNVTGIVLVARNTPHGHTAIKPPAVETSGDPVTPDATVAPGEPTASVPVQASGQETS